MKLQGRVVVLTGGGGDIGSGTSRALAAEGAVVIVTDIRQDSAENTAKLIRDAGGQAKALALNVLDEEAVISAFENIVTEFGRLDVLVNLAGDTVIESSIDTSVEEFDRILRLNITAQFITARTSAKFMLAHSGGSIINISSILGYGGTPRRAAYSASRAAIINLTRTLAVEWALQGVRVNCVAPGWTMTRALKSAIEIGSLDIDAMVERTPIGRLPSVDEIAAVIVFLASDDSRMVTGHTIPVDGGVTSYIGPSGKPSLA